MNLHAEKLLYADFVERQELLIVVGKRVRAARESIGLTRRELSTNSGVSERHIAQLETGKGNISVRLLQQIARAIETPIEQLVQRTALSAQAQRIVERMEPLDDQQKTDLLQHVEHWIEQHQLGGKNGRIALIGLRGAGKSTIGSRAALQLGMPFIEQDQEITRESGLTVADIFSLYGEQRYRELERLCLEKITREHSNFVLAVAGGIVSNAETYKILLNNFHTVWLTAEPEEHMGRVMAQGDRRPVEGNPDAMNNLRTLLASRQPHYQRAQYRLDTSGKSIADCSNELAQLIQQPG